MFFSFLVVLSLIFVVVALIMLILMVSTNDDGPFGGFLVFGIFSFIIGSFVFCVWQEHADNIAKVHYQQPVIDTLTERVEGLTERLANFDYPRTALVNRDTPVASLVESLSQAESELANAKMAQGKAIRALESTRLGPMSHVFWWVGDYK